MNSKELKEHLFYQSVNNINLIEKGLPPVSIEIIGNPGISKTASCYAVGKRLSEHYKKEVFVLAKNGSEWGTDTGNLVGYPVLEHLMSIEGEERWVPDSIIAKVDGISLGKTRQGQAMPKFVQELYEHEYSILVLDDIGRVEQIVRNALMEVINQRKYDTWTLPEKCLVITTTNYDENSNNASEDDKAQSSRKRTVVLDSLDIRDWYVDYAETKLHPLAANFAVEYWNNNLATALESNIRIFTIFAFSIDTALSDFMLLMEGGSGTLFEKKETVLQEIRNCGSQIGDAVLNLFISEFIEKLFANITNVEKEYRRLPHPVSLIDLLKKDIDKGNIMINNIQLRRLFNIVCRDKRDLSIDEATYFIDVVTSGLFEATAIKYYINTYLDPNPIILRTLSNTNGIIYKRLYKYAGFI